MKPTPLPEGNQWAEWPTLEVLQTESGLKVSALRARLAPLPCYRCPDKSVRYEPEASRRAVYADASPARSSFEDDEDDDTGDAGAGDDKQPANMAQLFFLALRMLADQRRESATTIRAMQEPLQAGLSLIREAMGTQAARLAHLEGVWDRMISVSEEMLATQSNRASSERTAEHTRALRQKTFELVKEQLPTLLNKWNLTTRAGLALEFLGSMDPAVLDMVVGSGVLTPEQMTTLERLRASLPKKPAPAPAEPPQSESEPPRHTENGEPNADN